MTMWHKIELIVILRKCFRRISGIYILRMSLFNLTGSKREDARYRKEVNIE